MCAIQSQAPAFTRLRRTHQLNRLGTTDGSLDTVQVERGVQRRRKAEAGGEIGKAVADAVQYHQGIARGDHLHARNFADAVGKDLCQGLQRICHHILVGKLVGLANDHLQRRAGDRQGPDLAGMRRAGKGHRADAIAGRLHRHRHGQRLRIDAERGAPVHLAGADQNDLLVAVFHQSAQRAQTQVVYLPGKNARDIDLAVGGNAGIGVTNLDLQCRGWQRAADFAQVQVPDLARSQSDGAVKNAQHGHGGAGIDAVAAHRLHIPLRREQHAAQVADDDRIALGQCAEAVKGRLLDRRGHGALHDVHRPYSAMHQRQARKIKRRIGAVGAGHHAGTALHAIGIGRVGGDRRCAVNHQFRAIGQGGKSGLRIDGLGQTGHQAFEAVVIADGVGDCLRHAIQRSVLGVDRDRIRAATQHDIPDLAHQRLAHQGQRGLGWHDSHLLRCHGLDGQAGRQGAALAQYQHQACRIGTGTVGATGGIHLVGQRLRNGSQVLVRQNGLIECQVVGLAHQFQSPDVAHDRVAHQTQVHRLGRDHIDGHRGAAQHRQAGRNAVRALVHQQQVASTALGPELGRGAVGIDLVHQIVDQRLRRVQGGACRDTVEVMDRHNDFGRAAGLRRQLQIQHPGFTFMDIRAINGQATALCLHARTGATGQHSRCDTRRGRETGAIAVEQEQLCTHCQRTQRRCN